MEPLTVVLMAATLLLFSLGLLTMLVRTLRKEARAVRVEARIHPSYVEPRRARRAAADEDR